MGDIFFVLKMIIYTVLLVLLMQIKVGSETVEERVITWTHKSSFSTVVKDIAEGAVRMAGVGYGKISGEIDSTLSKNFDRSNQPGNRLDSAKNFLQDQFGAEDNNSEGLQPESSSTH